MDGNHVKTARIALGGVAHKPWRASAAEQMLNGQPLTQATLHNAAAAALRDAQATARQSFQGATRATRNRARSEPGRGQRGRCRMNLIGQPLDRIDGLLKVTGEARYAADFPEATARACGAGHQHDCARHDCVDRCEPRAGVARRAAGDDVSERAAPAEWRQTAPWRRRPADACRCCRTTRFTTTMNRSRWWSPIRSNMPPMPRASCASPIRAAPRHSISRRRSRTDMPPDRPQGRVTDTQRGELRGRPAQRHGPRRRRLHHADRASQSDGAARHDGALGRPATHALRLDARRLAMRRRRSPKRSACHPATCA